MFGLKSGLLPGIALLAPVAALAAPVTYQYDGPNDTVCFVADYELDPQVPRGGEWALDREDVGQGTIIIYFFGGSSQYESLFSSGK